MSEEHKNYDVTISKSLVEWYNKNKRDLPWRETSDPYKIWISETILQQTRVVQGLDYYYRFIERFPTVEMLAAANEEEVLHYWQGLGYYSRARNLHSAAKHVVAHYKGQFPTEYAEVISLKGVGEYTAAAILSFAWNKPYPVVDGNVYRVLSRFFALDTPIDSGKGKKVFTQLAEAILDPKHALLHNQAIMELGALVCTPQNPSCLQCPLLDRCAAYAAGNAISYPVKQSKVKSRNRYLHYFHVVYDGNTFLHRRNGKDIWQGLFEFPLIETAGPMDFAQLKETDAFNNLFGSDNVLNVMIALNQKKHVLSHQVLYATFYFVQVSDMHPLQDKFIQAKADELDQYAMPRLLHIYLENVSENFAN